MFTIACRPATLWNRAFRLLILLVLSVGGSWSLRPAFWPSSQEAARAQLLEALRQHQRSVGDLADRFLQSYSDDLLGIWLTAEASSQLGRHDEAIARYQRLPQDNGLWEFQREFGLGQRYFARGRLDDAEKSWRRAAELAPDDLPANNKLGHLLQICGRNWEAAPCFLIQIQRGKCRGDELLATAVVERFFRHDERLERMAESPEMGAGLIRLAIARRAIFENREAEAEQLLREILAQGSHLGEAQGRLGRIIVERGDTSEFVKWRHGLPQEALRHPEVLFAEGLAARRHGLIPGAVHCFFLTLQQSPNHAGANLQLAGCLEQLGRSEAARVFAERANWMSTLEQNYNILRSNIDTPMILDSIDILTKAGREWEAAGWCYVLTQFDAPPPNIHQTLLQHEVRLKAHSSAAASAFRVDQLLDLSEFESPNWSAIESHDTDRTSGSSATAVWDFQEEARAVGIDFEYFEGTQEHNRLTHIFNVMGAGVGAVDFDVDGWVDLYLPQANNWRDKSTQPMWTDRLYRNIAGAQFIDVTNRAGIRELNFSHGITADDFDQDGFPDLYITNLGPNTLLHNNGDGTFTDVTSRSLTAGNEWSTSSVLADFSGDGLPDLLVLNYTLLEETARRECPNSNGEIRACTPDLLKAEQDRLYLNLGDGRFEDISETAGLILPDGKGLGVVVWDFEGDGRLGAFIANDTTPNYLLLNQRTDSSGKPHFQEAALVRGVAYDQDGNAQACMGVGAGDANGDGRLDLFITNFFGDSNTLYVGQKDGYFADLTRSFNLRDSGFSMLGFGCQFADLDGDGWEDLVATNGHVDQRTSAGTEDRMPPQIFQNQAGQKFDEIPSSRLGPFFQRKYLGRGLATLDWNRDGRTDFAISHLHDHFALVTNGSSSRGDNLVVRLAGRTGCRNAIGATLIARSGSHAMTRMLTGGSGFLSSNEPRLHLAWPGIQQFDELIVRWPGGREQTWSGVRAGQEILLIEGQSQPITLRVYETDSTRKPQQLLNSDETPTAVRTSR